MITLFNIFLYIILSYYFLNEISNLKKNHLYELKSIKDLHQVNIAHIERDLLSRNHSLKIQNEFLQKRINDLDQAIVIHKQDRDNVFNTFVTFLTSLNSHKENN